MKKVVEAGKDADELYREAKALGEDILRRRDELDAAINGTLENYSPERVSAIDRAILRLGAYELLHRKDLAAPIVISEAIRLAERFSSRRNPPASSTACWPASQKRNARRNHYPVPWLDSLKNSSPNSPAVPG